MSLDLQFQIKNNQHYQSYLHSHSEWYKYLNRNPAYFSKFVEEVKDAYQLRASDRFTKALETIEIMQSLMSSLR